MVHLSVRVRASPILVFTVIWQTPSTLIVITLECPRTAHLSGAAETSPHAAKHRNSRKRRGLPEEIDFMMSGSDSKHAGQRRTVSESVFGKEKGTYDKRCQVVVVDRSREWDRPAIRLWNRHDGGFILAVATGVPRRRSQPCPTSSVRIFSPRYSVRYRLVSTLIVWSLNPCDHTN